MWRPGSKLIHPFNPELGIGVVREVDGRFLRVHFPAVERELRLAAEASGLEPLELSAGDRARILASGEEVLVEAAREGEIRLADGRVIDEAELWPLDHSDAPLQRLARLRLDPLGSFHNRVQGLRLQERREAGGLGSFLGGRIELYPHQLHTARGAVQRDPVRWLLADEVGLGKTIEACLILSALVRTGRASRALIVAPATLVVQWLGELYRKFHQVFVLLDHERIDSVARDFGDDTNPFEVHPFGVISLDMLASDRRLVRLLGACGLDLVVVDEAHRLSEERNAREIGPLVERARHALLLTATPLQADREGFFELLRLLHPDAYASFDSFSREVNRGRARLPCTSAVRREDLGGLPPRVPVAVDLPALPRDRTDASLDPRTRWIAERMRGWLERGEKVLAFLHETAELERLKRALETLTRTHVSAFHERMSQAGRDIEVARFRDTRTPLLLCSEAGGEGRNFQFCDRMIHYDLPLDPVALEQRIGRLDRIGRRKPVEILYFRCAGVQPDVARLYERLDLFARPSAGLDAALAGVRGALERARADEQDVDAATVIREVERVRERGTRDLPRAFYPDAYEASDAADVLAGVPPDLEDLTREYCLGAAEDLGLTIVEKGGTALYFVELGATTRVEGLPGVPEGARYLGSFDRAEAVRRDEIEFFSSGHPLVEGLLLELEDGPRGRAALFETSALPAGAEGLLCVFRARAGAHFVVVDAAGGLRPEWRAPLLEGLGEARPLDPEEAALGEDFAARVEKAAEAAASAGVPGPLGAVAWFRSRAPGAAGGAR